MSTKSEGLAVEALSANALHARFEDIDPATVELARNRMIDSGSRPDCNVRLHD